MIHITFVIAESFNLSFFSSQWLCSLELLLSLLIVQDKYNFDTTYTGWSKIKGTKHFQDF